MKLYLLGFYCIPKLQEMLSLFFNGKVVNRLTQMTVAYGATVHSYLKWRTIK